MPKRTPFTKAREQQARRYLADTTRDPPHAPLRNLVESMLGEIERMRDERTQIANLVHEIAQKVSNIESMQRFLQRVQRNS